MTDAEHKAPAVDISPEAVAVLIEKARTDAMKLQAFFNPPAHTIFEQANVIEALSARVRELETIVGHVWACGDLRGDSDLAPEDSVIIDVATWEMCRRAALTGDRP